MNLSAPLSEVSLSIVFSLNNISSVSLNCLIDIFFFVSLLKLQTLIIIISLYTNDIKRITTKKKYITIFSKTGKSLIVSPSIIVVIIWEILSEIMKWQGVKKYTVNWIAESQAKVLKISPKI